MPSGKLRASVKLIGLLIVVVLPTVTFWEPAEIMLTTPLASQLRPLLAESMKLILGTVEVPPGT